MNKTEINYNHTETEVVPKEEMTPIKGTKVNNVAENANIKV